MSLISGSSVTGAGGAAQYEISRSLRFNSADSAYLNRTNGGAGSTTTGTLSLWVKRGDLGTERGIFATNVAASVPPYLRFPSDNTLRFSDGAAGTFVLNTTQVFRDVSAWYHIVVACDTTQGTSSNRIKIYVNGTQVTAFSTATYPNSSTTISWTAATSQFIGQNSSSASYFNGYLTEINFIDGQALTPSSFGETDTTTGVWKPKKYTGTYGTNGFYLNFSDNASTTTLGDDFSGNNNDWTTNNFSVTAGAGNDSLVDTPTSYGTDTGAGGEVRGNYATLNSAIRQFSAVDFASDGNLKYQVGANGGATDSIYATIPMTSGKWYCEVLINATATGQWIGVSSNITAAGLGNASSGVRNPGYAYRVSSGNKCNNDNVGVAYGASSTVNDIISIAMDADAGSITFYKNGVSLGVAFTGMTNAGGGWLFGADSDPDGIFTFNFGQRPFAYTAPSGFKALCTQNLPTPTIIQGDDYFNTILYTGTGSSNARTGVGFQPDFVWIKGRSGATDHGLYDAVRGVQQQLESNTTTDETTESTGLTAFGTDGFTVGALAQLNTSAATYVAWCWKESTTSAFDIVTYTGNGSARTISHNLGVVPNMIIVKARTTASTDQGWAVYHSANTAAPATDYLLLNSTAATADLDTVWNDTAPTSSVFSVGTNALVNANNDTYVAYLFANVAGYSAFGSYTGNGSTDGPFVYTGFRPRWIMIKIATGDTGQWVMYDTARDTYNAMDLELQAESSNAENQIGSNPIDGLSNGFKIRSTTLRINRDTSTFIYMAFAESPFKVSLAR